MGVNYLLLAFIGLHIFYLLVGYFIPILTSPGISVLLMGGGFLLMWKYAATAYNVLINRLRHEDDDGSHLIGLGLCMVGAGLFYGGTFNLMWVYQGSPSEWIGTIYSNYGRALSAVGCVTVFFGAATYRGRVGATSWLAIALLIVLVGLSSFIAGYQFQGSPSAILSFETHRAVNDNRPICEPDKPVWGASNSMRYHLPDSPYRSLLRPSHCFRTESEARAYGYYPISK